MSHKTQTVVRHWIELDEREQFDAAKWNGKPVRVDHLYVEVTDGSLSSVECRARAILKSGELSNVTTSIHLWSNHPLRTQAEAVLRARGIRVPERAK